MFFQEYSKRLGPFRFHDHSSRFSLSCLVFGGQVDVQELTFFRFLSRMFVLLVAVVEQLLLFIFLHLFRIFPRTSFLHEPPCISQRFSMHPAASFLSSCDVFLPTRIWCATKLAPNHRRPRRLTPLLNLASMDRRDRYT